MKQFLAAQKYPVLLPNAIKLFVFILLQCVLFSDCALTLQKQLQIHTGQITDLQFSADYSKFITASNDSKFILWNTTTISILASKILNSPINGIGINAATNQIIALLKNGKVQIYDSITLNLKNSYSYPNSGYGNRISFISNGEKYVMGGFDTGKSPQLHFFDKTHTYMSSIQTKFKPGSELTYIFNVVDAILFIASNEQTAPVGIEMYTFNSGQYVLTKQFLQSNGKVRGMSIAIDGANFYSVAEDLTLRNYTLSPFNNLYEISSVKYYDENPLAVNGLANAVTYVSTSSQIIEYFKTGEVSLETHYPTTSPINQIINLFPTLICTTTDGKLMIYSITFFDGLDHDMTKWIVLSSIMGGVVFILLIALVVEIVHNKRKEKLYDEEQQGLKQDTSKLNKDQIP